MKRGAMSPLAAAGQTSGDAAAGRRDDRVLPVTRVVAAVVMAILVAAMWVLYFHPQRTATLFAWTIKPKMTALVMGAGYGSAIYFYVRVLLARRWHHVTLGFLPTTAFTWLLLSATLLHWSKFHHGQLAFNLWIWVYIVTPVLVPGIWLLNRRTDPGTLEDSRDGLLPRRVRLALVGVGVVLLALCLVMFIWPSRVISAWPWKLTPLTARAIAGFIVLPGVSWLMLAADARWSAARATIQTLALGMVLLLIGVARAWSNFDKSNPLTWLYTLGTAATLTALAVLYAGMERLVRSQAGSPPAGRDGAEEARAARPAPV